MDAFSEVLHGVRLQGALYFTAAMSSPWRVSSPDGHTMASGLSPGARHLIIYHLIVEGTAWAQLPGEEPVSLAPGDIVVFPHGDPHALGHGDAPDHDARVILKKVADRDLTPLVDGGGGRVTRIVCGFMVCDPFLGGPVLQALPRQLTVNVRTDKAGHWLEQSLLHLVDEANAGRPGSEALLAKLSEALFVDTMRRHVAGLPDQTAGWLAGARDPHVGRCLALLHARPERAWTIQALADDVGVSRSTLIEKFARFLGDAPMTYLANWRLKLAAQALTTTSKGVAEIAGDVGYESEAAFNRAFKRAFGEPPARFRRLQRQAR